MELSKFVLTFWRLHFLMNFLLFVIFNFQIILYVQNVWKWRLAEWKSSFCSTLYFPSRFSFNRNLFRFIAFTIFINKNLKTFFLNRKLKELEAARLLILTIEVKLRILFLLKRFNFHMFILKTTFWSAWCIEILNRVYYRNVSRWRILGFWPTIRIHRRSFPYFTLQHILRRR